MGRRIIPGLAGAVKKAAAPGRECLDLHGDGPSRQANPPVAGRIGPTMVALILILGLTVELSLYAWAGSALAAKHAWAGWLLLPWVLACFFGLRLFFATLTRLVGRRYRDRARQAPPIGMPVYLAAVLWDMWCYVLVFALAQPLEAPLRRRRFARGEQTPVLLVHGLWCNGGMWWSMQRRLEAAGLTCATMNYAPPLASIDGFVPQLAQAIDDLLAETGARQVRLVCLSMGGLVTRAYLKAQGAGKVASVITLGTPHHGSGLAGWAAGQCVAQMRLGSEWLAALNRDEGQAFERPFVSVFSWQDNLVAPVTSSVLRGARNLAISGVGHVSQPWTPKVQNLVLALLDDPQAAIPGAEEVATDTIAPAGAPTSTAKAGDLSHHLLSERR